ncbi:hypothetical protein K7957_11115 [Sphingomonas yunnanensis]|uniref:hypothetical protein n=1 Tax=Sphingomonas yunnanensis TaxID=310400 RepID=UPI001CA6A3A1|nr:hypothetical protein [Sphingomonas yunnanensis]MBY9063480.1 hypothetical protein [Sphingomonas yunnanensis]
MATTALSLSPDARTAAMPLWPIATGVIVLAVAGRALSGWTAPFGFDETFSGVIAAQPSARALLDWCLHEIGGPVYYVLLWGWAALFGTSLAALRAFSMVASLGAPLLILRWGHPDRATRLYWAALLALWLPGLSTATNARCYALLLLVTTAQAIGFRRLLDRPTSARAATWVALSGVAVLTHYHAALLSLVQGLLLLALRPRDSLRLAPALLLLLPVAGWMAFHLSLLAHFAAAGAWYPLVGLADVGRLPLIFLGSTMLGGCAVAALLAALVAPRWRWRDVSRADAAVAWSAVLTLALLLLIGMLRPSFVWRYTFMTAPAALFGVTLWVRRVGLAVTLLPGLVLALFAASTAGRIAGQWQEPTDEVRYNLNLGRPSDWLVAQHATRLGFLWDSPTGRISEPDRIAEVIGFGPRQARAPVAVTVLDQPANTLPSSVIRGAIARGQIDSLIWLADASVPGTRERPRAAWLRRLGWRCRDFGGAAIMMVTCRGPD